MLLMNWGMIDLGNEVDVKDQRIQSLEHPSGRDFGGDLLGKSSDTHAWNNSMTNILMSRKKMN